MMHDNMSVYAQQTSDVQQMRDQLFSFNRSDPNAARKAIQNITLLRVYHQLERIVRYTDLMDQLEDRLYSSIQAKLMNSDPDDETLFLTLIPIQERLQKAMIESHKLLEPYLNMEQLSALEVTPNEDPANSFTNMILDQESRERVRTGVQELLAVINSVDAQSASEDEKQVVKNKAQEALTKLESSGSEEVTDA